MARLTQRMAEVWRWEGPVRFLYRMAIKILLPFVTFRISYVYLADLTRPMPVVTPIGDFDICLYSGAKDLALLLADLPTTGAITPEKITTRIQRGDWVAVAYAGKEVAGFSWATSNPEAVQELEPAFEFRRQEMFQYDSITHPRWRGRRIASVLSARVMQHGRDNGLQRSFSYVNFETVQSQKSAQRLGKQHVQTALAFRFRWMKAPREKICPSRRPALEPGRAGHV